MPSSSPWWLMRQVSHSHHQFRHACNDRLTPSFLRSPQCTASSPRRTPVAPPTRSQTPFPFPASRHLLIALLRGRASPVEHKDAANENGNTGRFYDLWINAPSQTFSEREHCTTVVVSECWQKNYAKCFCQDKKCVVCCNFWQKRVHWLVLPTMKQSKRYAASCMIQNSRASSQVSIKICQTSVFELKVRNRKHQWRQFFLRRTAKFSN